MNEIDIKEWIKLATHDSDTANLLVKENGHADIIIYHLHQATEKLLKALILKNGGSLEKIHFLDKLLSKNIGKYKELNDVKDHILELNLYLPKLRYPSGDSIAFEEAQDLQQKFQKIKTTILSILQNK
ncbi:hypothetical protein A2526_00210 [candidate division WOR-1 bacterium RIFOXYD2_FULL_36_8]|uniref:HEPN domain-containing protein n=1 Tax=candidate division WOR-1 bacterium RIFOXYB2_FULL_36_35 TaxID=1802578 RepID=A0A1F4S4E7_UNCSA|nr:MAG: hypothetical protein A2230_00910 [candidate division WOR-1 bacterium RIFOXYA2_FULL_36_21]OGC14242.1 MAG: hypothetical protein A2282_06625 [candidate division WOR-1 bacterium RIFOXYA12_FULL_36_13]OGC15247.1 MAG: hypothetical protein A2290_03120 [candidate division WOR-1 bacterium RIFOXYB2_FULL_36_35]OGC38258.1 MAG: hypothetical protein A2526_00210 [candidate division WOR-1 bacterium RIFOXYD2_FULL_36_8]